MIRTVIAMTALVGLTACGDGNPFTDGAEGDVTTSGVPEVIANDLESISFDAEDNTLVVRGLTQDGVPVANDYRHVATTFVDGYETFTAQNDAVGRHATAFVASRDGVQAGVVMTGGQFNRFFGGTYFERSGRYRAPTAPESRFDVTYVGSYAAGLNFEGPVTDLLPTTAGLDPDLDTPSQTAYIRGLMFVNVDLNDMSVEGEIRDQTAVLNDGSGAPGFLDLPDLVLVEGDLLEDGTFSGDIEIDQTDVSDPVVGTKVGDFAGLIGGRNGEFIVGGTNVEDFSDDLEDEIQYGVFVLDLCTEDSADPVCVNALADD